jgi:hypothetical protein
MKYIKPSRIFENEDDFYSEFNIILTDGIQQGMKLTLYHASENKELEVDRGGIHLGTHDQAMDRIDMLWDYAPTYLLHEVDIILSNPCPTILLDIDEGIGHEGGDFTRLGKWNEFIYLNKSEGFPDEEGNLSIFIADFGKSYLGSRVDTVINTGS